MLADNKLAEQAGWDRELLAIELQGLIELVFTDPPYNVAIEGHVCGLGRIRHRDFAMGCGEMSEAEFTSFRNWLHSTSKVTVMLVDAKTFGRSHAAMASDDLLGVIDQDRVAKAELLDALCDLPNLLA